jgi:hypothetical protein
VGIELGIVTLPVFKPEEKPEGTKIDISAICTQRAHFSSDFNGFFL